MAREVLPVSSAGKNAMFCHAINIGPTEYTHFVGSMLFD